MFESLFGKSKKPDPSEYLRQTGAVIEDHSVHDPDEWEALVNTLSKSLFEGEWRKEGHIDAVVSGEEGASTSIHIEYDSIFDERLRAYLPPRIPGAPDDPRRVNMNTYRRIREFSIGHGDITFSTRDLFGERTSLYIQVKEHGPQNIHDGEATLQGDLIICSANIQTIMGMIIFLHEVGHTQERTSFMERRRMQKIKAKERFRDELTLEEKAQVIRSEHFANAFMEEVLHRGFEGLVDMSLVQRYANRWLKTYYPKEFFQEHSNIENKGS